MNKTQLDDAFRRIGEKLPEPVTIVVAGGAMLVLTEAITREAGDCDLVRVRPADREAALTEVADDVGGSLGLEAGWLNTQMVAWDDEDEFPAGWEARVTPYRSFGRLQVECISRLDAIALKAVTTLEREDLDKDLADLAEIKPTNAEIDFTTQHIDHLEQQTDSDLSRLRVALMQMRDMN